MSTLASWMLISNRRPGPPAIRALSAAVKPLSAAGAYD